MNYGPLHLAHNSMGRPQKTNMKGNPGVEIISYDVKSCIAFCFLGCFCMLSRLIHMNGLAR